MSLKPTNYIPHIPFLSVLKSAKEKPSHHRLLEICKEADNLHIYAFIPCISYIYF